ncbi:GAF domain-containing protein [Gluconacetobacter takamatsuzukensis]|uniref:GAF domain-containing protein n=1 Tax=Gluconacetobacter takamatsuzukensis TaxID=1286190 RepID=A0A7W4PP32_9PROT|nr:GAF domain-containing protein [Gluconacetobacter takamatsuzukensis]MBB2205252.1 GAF domain-containing protein [Gluconacetobacter takamatsuzukensis]
MSLASPATHASRIQASIAADAAARSGVVASWRRCIARYGLDPHAHSSRHVLTESELRRSDEQSGPFLSHVMQPLSHLSTMLAPFCMWVGYADPNGVILAMRAKDGDKAQVAQWGLTRGADWSEAIEGTNGIGTCLVEETPLIINSDEHFFARDMVMTCVVAPIFDHQGRIGGAFNVSLYGPDMERESRRIVASLVASAARQVECDHFHAMFPAHRIISLGTPGRSGNALLAVDSDDVVYAATRAARVMLKLSDARLQAGICANDLLNTAEDGLPSAERSAIRRALIRSGGNVSAAGRTLGLSRATINRRVRYYGLKGSVDSSQDSTG